MSEAFLKAIRWYFIAACVVIGTSCFILADKYDTIKPVGVSILAYGTVYIMTAFWKDVRGKLLAANIAVFFLLTLLSNYIYDVLYVFFGLQTSELGMLANPYLMWGIVVGVVGIPIMAIIFFFYE